jgi:hypothetical protein
MNGDSELLDFMDDNAVQAWPERQRQQQTHSWTVQLPKPFTQVSRPTLRMALRDLMFKSQNKS